MRHARFLLYIVLQLLIVTLLSGCGKENLTVEYTSPPDATVTVQDDDTRFLSDMIGGQDYANGSHMEMLEANPLLLDTVASASVTGNLYDNSYYVYHQLTNLIDVPIQKTINKRIKDAATYWCETRPVPDDEVYTSATEEARDGAYYGISTNFTFSYCDYLSGIMTRTIDYYDPETMEHTRFTRISPINIDLRTGEEFSLAALFVNGYDYDSAINTGAMAYCKANGLNPRDLKGIASSSGFCLSANGLVLYPDKSYEDQGIAQGTPITIPFSHFGGNWAISRTCSDIYDGGEKGACILLANPGENILTESTDIYASIAEDGTVTSDSRLSVVHTHTYPDDFPEGLFAQADAYSDTYAPSTKVIENLKKSEDQYLLQTYDAIGSRVGSYCCVTMNAVIKQSDEITITAVRQYVYDKAGEAVDVASCFAEDYDTVTLISGKLAEQVNALMEDGWLIESEIDMASVDFMPGIDSMTFSTAPIRRSRSVTGTDGTETKEIVCESMVVNASYDEIGAENLRIFGL